MCGITGWQGSFDIALLEEMTSAVAHRGPDGDGASVIHVEGRPATGLGHRRLAIIDLSSAGSQPMTVAADSGGGMETGLTLVYNGEIYNYRELRAELKAAGHVFKTETDSEVLLHLYERNGLEMLRFLNGIFAFAIHDARRRGRPVGIERGDLFIARDHLGVKPLYYAEVKAGFLFASEIKSLLRHRELSREIDPVALHQMLAYLWTPAPRTMLAGVKKLEPGAALIVSSGKVKRHWSHYTIPYDGTTDSRSSQEIAADISESLATAVRRQLVADVPVGAFLSGGLDSSAIVAMMCRNRPASEIVCFSIGFKDESSVEGNPSDMPYARKVARHLGVNLHEVRIDPSAIDRLDQMLWLLDEPQADPAPINAWLIAERSRAMGIPVLLSGAGGDDLFSGYRRHWALQFERRWSWLPQGLRNGIQSSAQTAASGGNRWQSNVTLRRLAKMFAYAGEDSDHRLAAYFWWSTEQVRRALYTPEFAERTASVDTAAPLLHSLQSINNERNPLQRMLYLEARHFLADHNLNYTDRAGMAEGVEIRVPFLDLDLVHLATRVPAKFKQRGRIGKAILKQALQPYLPREVIYRPKSGFGVPLRRWLREELRERVDDTLQASSLQRRGFFEPAAVQRLIELDRKGAIDGSYTIFALVCFELWCRQFVDV
jgi:asparagine synthase (glutamine-hydrolysing)